MSANSNIEDALVDKVVEAARGVLNCVDEGDQVATHFNGGGACLYELEKALAAFDKQTRKRARIDSKPEPAHA